MTHEEILAALDKKINDSWRRYQTRITGYAPQLIFNRAKEIALTEMAVENFRNTGYPTQQLEYLLRFEDPLTVVRDRLLDVDDLLDETMEYTLWDLWDKGFAEESYELDPDYLPWRQEDATETPASAAEPAPMGVDRFWSIIEQAGKAPDASGSIANSLTSQLKTLQPQEILQFGHVFSRYHQMADKWLMWSAANLFAGNLSDDGFMDFRSWLVSRGREVFQRVMADPDNLADFDRGLMPSDESTLYAASTAYDAVRAPDSPDYYDSYNTVTLSDEQVREIPESVRLHPQFDRRVESAEDAEELLPRCHEKFSEPDHDYNTWLHPVDFHSM